LQILIYYDIIVGGCCLKTDQSQLTKCFALVCFMCCSIDDFS